MDTKKNIFAERTPIERKIGNVTFVISVEQGPNARETLNTKLQKMILEAASKEKRKSE